MTSLPARRAKPEAVQAIRCAIYTRVSTDERLGQEFNSLHNQRESAEAYVRAQREAGWETVPERYDDAGYSGGTLDRPALRRLLADVQAGRIQRVVVYKIDRLSRSLADFVRLAEAFEAQGASIVSVTQQFDTATSMGRLTLNMLLSFAQFEREMIAERTADKMAASRRKGKWVGGIPILGYDVAPEGGRLLVNEAEAARVRAIFDLYLEHEGLLPVVQELNRRGWTTKTWKTKAGPVHQGVAFTKTLLHRLLTNIAYSGRVNYKGSIYAGEHEAIIAPETFERVQRLLQQNRVNGGAVARSKHGALLGGLLGCAACGSSMIHAPTARKGRLYRYYRCRRVDQNGAGACPTGAVRAEVLEGAVLDHVRAVGRAPAVVLATLAEARAQLAAKEPALRAELAALEADLARHRREMDRLVELVASGDQIADAAAGRIAETQDAIGRQEARLREVQAELDALSNATVDEADLRRALRRFEPVWDALFHQERVRILHLLIERIEYDGAEGKVALTFRPTGIKALAAEAQP